MEPLERLLQALSSASSSNAAFYRLANLPIIVVYGRGIKVGVTPLMRVGVPEGWAVYVVGFLLVSAFFVAQIFISLQPFWAVRFDALNNLQEKEIEIFLEMNRLITTLATLIFASIGAIVFHRYKDTAVPRVQWRRAVACSAFSAFSIGLGYMTYLRLGWMLRAKFFDLTNPLILWTSGLQFFAFLLSVLLFADFAYRGLRRD